MLLMYVKYLSVLLTQITAWRSVLKAGAELKNKKQRDHLTPPTSTHWLENNYEPSGRAGYINDAN